MDRVCVCEYVYVYICVCASPQTAYFLSLRLSDVEMLLVLVQSVGMRLRKDDPAALRDVLGRVQVGGWVIGYE
jgi:hypothetical protein